MLQRDLHMCHCIAALLAFEPLIKKFSATHSKLHSVWLHRLDKYATQHVVWPNLTPPSILSCCRAGTLAIAGDLGGLQIANTGTGTVYTSGVASAAATAVSGSGRTILIPSGGEAIILKHSIWWLLLFLENALSIGALLVLVQSTDCCMMRSRLHHPVSEQCTALACSVLRSSSSSA